MSQPAISAEGAERPTVNAQSPNATTVAKARLRADPGLGMGNFLWKALEVFPEDYGKIVSVRPLQTAWGEHRSTFTLRDLGRIADAYARRYAAFGVSRQDPVGVYVDHGIKY